MHAVAHRICPEARIVDLCHEVPPQALGPAAYLLDVAEPYMPDGAVVVAVVDPGVGTARRAVAIACRDGPTLVGPDNGIFDRLLDRRRARRIVALDDEAYWLPERSATFHGRDIFTPVGAHLAAGVEIEELGTRLERSELVALERRAPVLEEGRARAHVLHVDHFGNLIVDLRRFELDSEHIERVVTSGREVPFGETFSDVEVGAAVAYFGSGGYLEVAVREGDAATLLGAERGASVEVLLAG
jgi:hypothetical protein